MQRYEYLRSLISGLLDESPLTSQDVIADVRYLMSKGEEELAFKTMCSWIYEDALSISVDYHERLLAAARELGTTSKSIEKLDELVKTDSRAIPEE